MPKIRQTVPVTSPGARGLNTEDAPSDLDFTWCRTADNAVIDKSGRLAARKGLKLTTESSTPLGTSAGLISIASHNDVSGFIDIFSSGNGKLLKGTTSLTNVSPSATSITADNWKFVSWDDELFAFQAAHAPLKYDNGGTNLFVAITGAPVATDGAAAFGRLWALKDDVLYWSDLLDGDNWSSGTSGNINLVNVWPNGFDTGVAVTEFDNFLVIFGRNSIVVYSGATDPSKMSKFASMSNVGLVDRDAYILSANDLFFMSNSGVRSLGRTIQEQALPEREVSRQITTDIVDLIINQDNPIKAVYVEEENIILFMFTRTGVTYCFDTKRPLDDGSLRATRWIAFAANCAVRDIGGTTYLGGGAGVHSYSGYQDLGSDYPFRFYTNPSDMGAPSVIKMLKEIHPVVVGNQTTDVVLKWGYGYGNSYSSSVIGLTQAAPALYGVALFNDGEYYTGGIVITDPTVYADGSGEVVSVGIEANINANTLSLQELNIQLVSGRTH